MGGRRFLAMTPEPASWGLWGTVARGRRNVNLVRLDDVDARGSASDSPPLRAKVPSAGGDMTAYSSSDGRVRSLPPLWAPVASAKQCAGAMSSSAIEDQKYDQIL